MDIHKNDSLPGSSSGSVSLGHKFGRQYDKYLHQTSKRVVFLSARKYNQLVTVRSKTICNINSDFCLRD